jgi:hypothetical protein
MTAVNVKAIMHEAMHEDVFRRNESFGILILLMCFAAPTLHWQKRKPATAGTQAAASQASEQIEHRQYR